MRPLALLGLTLTAAAGLAETPDVPGTVIYHSPAASRAYVGSPGIAILPDGSYLAKCDEFGKGTTEFQSAVSRVFRSDDRGRTWRPTAVLNDLFWASVFVHEGSAYLIGTTKHHGLVNVRRSDDGGETWTDPADTEHGLITPTGEYHTAPGPVVVHDGRLWRGVEDAGNGTKWGYRYSAMMMSAPVDADLLKADSWTFSNKVGRDGSWLGGDFKAFLEGNAVLTRDGRIENILRVQRESGRGGTAAVCEVSDDGRTLTFDPETGFIGLPGADKKFTIRFDPQSDFYYALTSPAAPTIPTGRDKSKGQRAAGGVRNTMALVRSTDLREWEVVTVLLHHPDVETHGFQYPDWVFDGADIVAAVRTAYDEAAGQAHRAHDANYLTFHRIADFRRLGRADSVVDAASLGF